MFKASFSTIFYCLLIAFLIIWLVRKSMWVDVMCVHVISINNSTSSRSYILIPIIHKWWPAIKFKFFLLRFLLSIIRIIFYFWLFLFFCLRGLLFLVIFCIILLLWTIIIIIYIIHIIIDSRILIILLFIVLLLILLLLLLSCIILIIIIIIIDLIS